MKKVYCLYRVSTMHQVEYSHDGDGDIPMQKTACHEFASRQDQWIITKEFYEKGISGYKVSAEDRDAIQDLKRAAEQGEFDVLLVFKFDRLGRIESETPFILEWFVSHGIEIWSTKEGQQKIETRTDKLINFLRFWQAGTESENTSQRVSTAMRQMVSIGRYVGGVTPFGYHTVEKIDEAISELVRQYLDCLIVTPRTMAVEKRYRHKISELNDRKRSLEKENARIDKQLAGLTAEVAKSIAGESRFDADTLSIAISNAKNEMNENRKNIAVCTSELEKQKELLGGIGTKYDLFRSWADLYDKATPEIKKMIVCRLIQRIEIGKGYELTVYFNPSFLQFLGKESEDNVKIVLPRAV